jgi:hypothetical protein
VSNWQRAYQKKDKATCKSILPEHVVIYYVYMVLRCFVAELRWWMFCHMRLLYRVIHTDVNDGNEAGNVTIIL